ncbi:CHAT domain-containing protein [Tropicimonas sp. S265A]|uniref:CHAT domain-containing protein n=1 Tax=Tropicimonas sp. S265A TaxID=3415134 RepID=UPI003C7D3673
MSDFIARILERPEKDVPVFLVSLTEAERRSARDDLLREGLTTRDEAGQRRLVTVSTALELSVKAPGADPEQVNALIWPKDQSFDMDPAALLDASAGWSDVVTGARLGVLQLARATQMKHLAQTSPPAQATDLWAEAIGLCNGVAESADVPALLADARFLEAGLRVDRAASGMSQDAPKDIDEAVAAYEELLVTWKIETHTRDHILVQSNLASCFQQRASRTSGAAADAAMTQAIALFEETVRLAKRHEHLQIAANARFSLAVTLFTKAQHEDGALRDASLTAAIESFEDLREIWGGDEHRGARVKAMVNQSVVLSHRGRTRTAQGGLQDFEAAAALCAQAIETFRTPGNEGDLARAWTHRANAFWSMSRRKAGTPARQDLEVAHAAHREAEKIWIRLGARGEHADCLMDQAIVLSSMAESEIGYEALKMFDKALAVFGEAYETKQELGDTFGAARVARNLATAWFERGENTSGAQARADLTRAIDYYEKAAAPFDRDTDSAMVSEIEAEKAGALLTRAQHQTGAAQLSDLDAAISLLEQRLAQLQMPQDASPIASFSFNCGMAYAQRAKRLPPDRHAPVAVDGPDARRAAELYEIALDVFAAPEDAVRAFDPLVALAELLVWQAENGLSASDRLLQRAVDAAARAMQTYDVLLDPRRWLNAAEVHCHALFVAGHSAAEGALRQLLDQGNRLVISLPDTDGQETALRALSGVGDRLAVLRARRGDLSGAFAAVGQGRSIRATRDISLRRAGDAISELRDEMLSARTQVQALDRMRETTGKDTGNVSREYDSALDTLKQRQVALEAALVQHADGTTAQALDGLDALASSLAEDTALAVPLLSETGGGVLLAANPADGPCARFLELPGLTRQAVERLLDTPGAGWMDVYATTFADTTQQLWDPAQPGASAFMAALDVLLCDLWDILMGPLQRAVGELLPGVVRGSVVLVPPGRLAGLPLGAAKPAPGSGARPFLADWAVAYAQSPAAWLDATRMAEHRKTGTQRLLAVSDPTEDLAVARTYALVDGTWRLTRRLGSDGRPKMQDGWEAPGWSLFSPNQRVELAQRDATIPAVCAEISGASHAVFFCHGGWDRDRGSGSGLLMAGPLASEEAASAAWPGDMMTLSRMEECAADLSSLRVCVLGACETAPVGLSLPDEFNGFAYALSLRVPMVVSTLFPVTPTATALVLNAALILHLGPAKYAMPLALARSQLAAALGGDAALRFILETGAEPASPKALIVRSPDPAAVPVPIARAAEPTMRNSGDGAATEDVLVLDRHPFYWAAYVAIGVAPADL